MKMLKRRYPSTYASVSKARREVTSFARGCGLLPSDVSDIALATGEACNNAAEHGHVAEGRMTVRCSYENGQFVIEVDDEGCGFNPAGKGECLDPEKLGIRGLGIFIMRSLMDDISYSKTGHGMCVRMIKYAARAVVPRAATKGLPVPSLGLGAVHHRLKALFEAARFHPGSRRQR